VLSREDGSNGPELVAEVTDNGSGISGPAAPGPEAPAAPEAPARSNGMGLRIMRYRAESAGARLSIEDLAPGTRVCCRIPVTNGGG